jgi:TPR repeat protein
MDQPFFRRLFSRSPVPTSEGTETRAERGSAEAQFRLGLNYANGDRSAQNYGQAAKWYLKAAEQNHALAQFNLGTMYASGQGVHQDESEAEIWFGKAAQQGDAAAQHCLGMGRYRASIRLPENMRESRIEACKWFILAAAQGYRGSDAARDTLVLKMTHEDVAEATQRVVSFTHSIRSDPASQ